MIAMTLSSGKFKGRDIGSLSEEELNEAFVEAVKSDDQYHDAMKTLHLRSFERLMRVEAKLDLIISKLANPVE